MWDKNSMLIMVVYTSNIITCIRGMILLDINESLSDFYT